MNTKAEVKHPDLSNAVQYKHSGYPMLRVDVAGRTAYIMAEVKPTIYAAGLVYLGGEFSDLVPDITITPADGYPTELEGFSADPRLFELFRRFLAAANSDTFDVGPVPIPPA